MIKVGVAIITRPLIFFCGLYWINVDYVSTGEGDYSKWLGPDWKPDWSNPSTIVSNHVSWFDIIVALVYFCPSFVSKNSVKKYPGVGRIAIAIECVFFDRAGSKEEKWGVVELIKQRQLENEKLGKPSILIYPEGSTTNGEQLIAFKRGAFQHLNSVQPTALKYRSSNGVSIQNDVLYGLL